MRKPLALVSLGVVVLDGTGILAILAAAAGLALTAGTGGNLLAARRA